MSTGPWRRDRKLSLVEQLQRQLDTANATIRSLRALVPVSDASNNDCNSGASHPARHQDRAARARDLYRAGYSNHWIAQLLGIEVSEVRRLTHLTECR